MVSGREGGRALGLAMAGLLRGTGSSSRVQNLARDRGGRGARRHKGSKFPRTAGTTSCISGSEARAEGREHPLLVQHRPAVALEGDDGAHIGRTGLTRDVLSIQI